jgi:hypothetical protein
MSIAFMPSSCPTVCDTTATATSRRSASSTSTPCRRAIRFGNDELNPLVDAR